MNAPFRPPPPGRRPLTPREAAIVREFAAALRAVYELEVERLHHSVKMLERYCDGVARLERDEFAWYGALLEKHSAELIAAIDAAVQKRNSRAAGVGEPARESLREISKGYESRPTREQSIARTRPCAIRSRRRPFVR
jgi:hypothetical protein